MNSLKIGFEKKGYSFWISILIIGIFFSADMLHHKWMNDDAGHRGVIKHDVIGYYSYLPSIFVFDDYTLSFIGTEGYKNENRFLSIKLENGNRLIQYTSGLSILYAPFFLTAHAIAPLFGEKRDGFNWVYQFFLVMSALFYFSLGLIALRKLLLNYFSDRVTAIVLVIIALGTNLFYYTVYEGPMSHSYSFALIAVFLFMVDSWYKSQTPGRTMLLGFIFGLLVLVRPTNVIVIILLLLWGIRDFKDIRERFLFFLRKMPLILLMVFFFFIPWIPQLLYWKSITGHFLFNSYESVGSAFYFDAPQTLQMLFSFRKGWFIYTPVMFIALSGFVMLYHQRRSLLWSTVLYMFIMIYVLSSWWAWWFGGGFGSRSMVDTYAVMAFPLAILIDYVLEKKNRLVKYSFVLLFTLLIALQWMQTAQYNHGSIHYVSMNKNAYWHHFFKVKHRGVWNYLSEPDHQLARLGIYYYYEWSKDYDAFRALGEEGGRKQIAMELTSNSKTMRSIHRYARRNEMTDEKAMDMVLDRIYDKKRSRENFY